MVSKRTIGIVLAGIILAGGFLRLYNHANWLHFELDQSRDAEIIMAALENGPEELPLQGPRAAGTFLRLGPGFYYLEYVSALVFGGTPSGMALFVALFSIATIPVAFLFLKRYFRIWIALSLAALFAVSPFFVLYGRFAWNPNPLPLLIILGAYALLRAVDDQERHRNSWFSLSAFSFGLATHMHFLALVVIGVSVVLFLFYKKSRFSWFVWMLAIGIIGTLYLPIFVNEYMTGGKNAEQFTEAIFGKTDESKHNWMEKFMRNVQEHANHYQLMLFGDENSMTVYTRSEGSVWFDAFCNDRCRALLLKEILYSFIFVIASVLLFWRAFRERDIKKKDFLVLTVLWFVVSFFVFLPLSFESAPRFFLAVCFVPLVFFGLALEEVAKLRFYGKETAAILAGIFLLGAGMHTYVRLSQLDRSQHEPFRAVYDDAIMREKDRVTLGSMQAVVDYMESKHRENGYPVYRYSESFYRRSFAYLLDIRGIRNDSVKTKEVYREGNYFLIFRVNSDIQSKAQKYLEKYDVLEKKMFGTLMVWHCVPKLEMITEERQEFSYIPGSFSAKNDNAGQKRYIWSEVIGEDEAVETEE